MAPFPISRLRRLRGNPAMRDMFRETNVSLNDLIYPIFVEEELDDFAPVESMPGIHRIPEKKLGAAIKEIHRAGIKAVMTFGVSRHKDDTGSDSWSENGLLARMIRRAKDAVPEMLVISDTCFCEYTSHGHCGVIHGEDVHNDHTIENLGLQSVVAARAGADMIAPSAMMDGQVAAIRSALDGGGFTGVPIMAYSSKFASAFYGPFRAAAGCEASVPFITSVQPAPPGAMPRIIRPPDNSSTSAAALAISNGVLLTMLAIPDPRRMRSVTDAFTACTVKGLR